MITQDDIIYFIVTDRFFNGNKNNDYNVDITNPAHYHGGDFEGIVQKIPYLKELGITAVWITPVYLSIGEHYDAYGYHGYWTLDFEKVDPHLYTREKKLAQGSKQYLKKLSDTLHKNDIKLILDMVVNHTGYHNNEYKQYPNKKIQESWFNETGHKDDIKRHLDGLPDLNHDNPDVADFFVNNITDWIEEAGIDGIRMDTVKHVEDKFWYYFKSYVRGKHRNITLIGEVLEAVNIEFLSRYQTKHDFDSLFDFPLCRQAREVFVHNAGMTTLARPRLSDGEIMGILDWDTEHYSNANRLVTLLDNHDYENRIKTEILEHYGNKANKILKLCLSFLFTTRGIPQLYYGTEIGMEGGKDHDARRDMEWDVFNESDSRHEEAMEIFEHTKALIKIRKENPAISFGYLFTLYSDDSIYSYMREYRGNVIIVVINNTNEEISRNVALNIEANTNIPSRIKSLFLRKTLINYFDEDDTITSDNGAIEIKTVGKQAKIYKLE